jgi:hypothetical protein
MRVVVGRSLWAMGLLGVLFALACFEPPRLVPRDAGRDAPPGPEALVVTALEVRSFDDRPFAPEAAPRRPRLVLTSSAAFTGSVPLWLLRGAPDEALREDLATSPLRREHLDRAVRAELHQDGARVELVPSGPLEAGATYTLALAAWAERLGARLGRPATWVLTVGSGPAFGAAAALAWPPDGAVEVGTAPALLLVALDGALGGLEGVGLEGPEGPIVSPARPVDCAAYGLEGVCVALVPAHPLAPRARHQLVVRGALDATGAPVPPFASRFLTAPGPDETPPALLPLPCFVDEIAREDLCVRVGEAELSVRARSSEPVRATLLAGDRVAASLAPRGEVVLRLPHAGTSVSAELALEDLAGRRTTRALPVAPPRDLPRLVLTEVRADPLGPEPQQEYVELCNEGSAALDLSAFTLADGFDRLGDPLPALRVPPGARVLVVADAFDPDEPSDSPPIPAGVPLARIGSALGEGGLSSAGEPLVLRFAAADGTVHRISELPALRVPEPGACLARRGAGVVLSREACTPGTE